MNTKIAKSSTRKKRDTIFTGAVSGIVGAMSMEIINIILYRARKGEALHGHMAGQLFVSPRRTKQPRNLILGEFLHLVVGGFFGIPMIYLLKKTGKDHHKFKGIGLGMLLWGALYDGGQRLGLFKKFGLTRTHYLELITHAVYGWVTSFTILKMTDRNTSVSLDTKKPLDKMNDDESEFYLTQSRKDEHSDYTPMIR